MTRTSRPDTSHPSIPRAPRAHARRIGPLSAVVLASALAGCTAAADEAPIAVKWAVSGALPADMDTADGAHITLTEARVHAGGFYAFENPASAALAQHAPNPRVQTQAPSRLATLWRTAAAHLIPAAHAHGGDTFFAGGRAVAEWAAQTELDLLAGNTTVADGTGVTAVAQSVAVEYRTSADATLLLRGTAEKDGETRAFVAALSPTGAPDDNAALDVPFPAGPRLAEGDTIRVHIAPDPLFTHIAFFDDVADAATEDGVLNLDNVPGAATRLWLAFKSTGAYTVTRE